MPAFPTAIFRAWTVTFAVLRFCARLGIGLLGVYWLIAGVVGAVTLPFVGLWEGVVGAMLFAFIGWSLAYGAFKWWPWEAQPRPEHSPATHRVAADSAPPQ
jgi:putative Mn2+ efflux pump MntP